MILASRNSGDPGVSSCANEECLCVNILLMAFKRGLLVTRIRLQRQVDGTVGLSTFVTYVNPSNFPIIFSPNLPQSFFFFSNQVWSTGGTSRGVWFLGSRILPTFAAIGVWSDESSNLRYLLQEASGGDLRSHVGR